MRRFQTGRLRLFAGVLTIILIVSPVIADVSYTVKPGDSLSKIAKHFVVSLSELTATNHISHPQALRAGQVLTIPAKSETGDVTLLTLNTALPTKNRAAQPRQVPPMDLRSLMTARARLLEQEQRRRDQQQVTQDSGNRLVANAQGFLGTPYRWSGSNSRGIDCSGLVYRSMALSGKNVPHNAAALYKMGTPVSYAELQPGDLVFFHTTRSGVSHVGIWIGDNHFIHSSTKYGVVQQRLAGYYAKRFVGARRLH